MCICVLLTLTDRAVTIPSNVRGCQSGTWFAGQENIRGTLTRAETQKRNRNDYYKGRKGKQEIKCDGVLKNNCVDTGLMVSSSPLRGRPSQIMYL